MEEILASIRRIIESGDERPTPKGDVLHDAPAPVEDDSISAEDDGPSWDFGSLTRDFSPANADAPQVAAAAGPLAELPAAPETGSSVAGNAVDLPVGAFVAAVPDETGGPEAISLDEPPEVRLPRREAMPRRHERPREGLSLASAYRREALATADAFAEQAVSAPEPRFDDLVGVSEGPAAVIASDVDEAVHPDMPAAPTSMDVPSPSASLPERISDAVDADFAGEFDEEQFSSELHMAVGLDRPAGEKPPASAEPSVITAASSLMSEAAGAQVAAAFDDLARAIRDGQMKSMEEMAREMLRPMLQEWLDDNLPRIVERLVREEIERVSRGPRR